MLKIDKITSQVFSEFEKEVMERVTNYDDLMAERVTAKVLSCFMDKLKRGGEERLPQLKINKIILQFSKTERELKTGELRLYGQRC